MLALNEKGGAGNDAWREALADATSGQDYKDTRRAVLKMMAVTKAHPQNNNNYVLYCVLLRDYHRELREGNHGEAERIFSRMDKVAESMSWEECCKANRFSAELWEANVEETSLLLVKYIES